MVSSLMTSSMALANRAPFTSRPPVPCRAAPQRARVVAAASQDDGDWKPEKAPGKAVMRAVGALAAVQLAFLPAAGADVKDLLPDSATSSSARAAVNERTSNLPSFTDVGDSLRNAIGGSSDPKDIGRAIDRNTPDGPDLTKNPKNLAEDAKQGAKNLAGKIQNAAPDLSAVDDPLTDRTGLPNAFDKGSGTIPRASDITELADRAKKEASAIGGDVAQNAPDVGDLKNAGANVASKAKSAASKVQNAVGDNAGLFDFGKKAPSPQEAAANVKGVAKDAQNRVGNPLQSANQAGNKLANKAGDVGKVGNQLQTKGNELKAKADQAGRKVQSAVGNTAGLPSPQEAADKVKGAANEVGRKAQGLGDSNPLSGNIPSPQEAGDKLKGKANEAGRKAQNAVGDNAGLPSPQEAADKVKGAANEVGRKAQGLGDNNPLSGNIPSPQEAGDKLKGKANEAGRKAQNAVGDNAGLPSPQEAADKVKDALSGSGGGGEVGSNLQSKAAQISDKAGDFPGASKDSNALGGPSEIADKMQTFKAKVEGQASGLGGKVQNAVGDNAGLPSPQEAADKVKGAANEVGRKAQGLGDNNPLSGNIPSPQEASDKLKGKANEAGRKAQNAVGDNAGLPSPQEAADKVKSAVSGSGDGGEVGRNLQSKAAQISDKAGDFPGASKDSNAAGGPSEIADKMATFSAKVQGKASGLGGKVQG